MSLNLVVTAAYDGELRVAAGRLRPDRRVVAASWGPLDAVGGEPVPARGSGLSRRQARLPLRVRVAEETVQAEGFTAAGSTAHES